MIDPRFVLIGVALQSFGGVRYVLDTIKGRVQPNKVSWMMWSIAPLVAFAAEVSQGVGLQSLTTFIVGFVPLVIFLASFKNRGGGWKLGKFDLACGIMSLVGVILWSLIRVGNTAILFSILADGLAAIPTVMKSYSHPESENHLVYSTGIINAGLGLMAITEWNFQHYAFPAYLLFINTLISCLIWFRPHSRAAAASES